MNDTMIIKKDTDSAVLPTVGRRGKHDFSQLAWDIDWNLLRTFMVIVEQKSITAAANYLGLKQPTVSNALRRLETALGVQLAERDPRNFILNQQGEALFGECREIFGSIGRLPNLLADTGAHIEGHISLSVASHVVSPLIDSALADFHKAHPRTSFSISVESSHDVVEAVEAKRATLGICLLRTMPEDLATKLVYREHFGFFCGPGHELYGQKNLSLEALRGHKRVTFATDSMNGLLQPVASLRASALLEGAVAGLSNNLEEVRRMIQANLGYGPLPVHVVERDVKAGRLWRLPPYENPPAIDVFLVSNPRTHLSAAEVAFLDHLNAVLDSTPLTARTYGAERWTFEG